MQFKHPELLYALFLLLIPIFIHLFQLRRFQKVDFTNVAFLKKVTIETRKSSQLKKWLTLLMRLLAMACLIIAFAQPFTATKTALNTEKETVIYLDNSFSMQAKGGEGPLLQRSLQNLYSQVSETQKFSWFTNDFSKKNTTASDFKNEILSVEYSAKQLSPQEVLLKANQLFSKDKNSTKRLIYISDFQLNDAFPEIPEDIIVDAVQLKPIAASNITIDSIYTSSKNAGNIQLKVDVSKQGEVPNNIPVSLYKENTLIAKTAVDFTEKAQNTILFDIENTAGFNGRIELSEQNIPFDNNLFFNINSPNKIKILSINQANASFLQQLFDQPEFEYIQQTFSNINYNDLPSQNLIILNELTKIPNSLQIALKSFVNAGGSIFVIPPKDANLLDYNTLLNNFKIGNFSVLNEQEKRITQISFDHPLYKNVFEKQVLNFQYPKVNSFFNVNSNASSVLKFEDGKPFILQKGNVYISSASLNLENSNFQSSPLIVPTLYNMAQQSLTLPKLYYIIGKRNDFSVAVSLMQDEIITIKDDVTSFIPLQQTKANKVNITTTEEPNAAGTYQIYNDNTIIERVSYNYSRKESLLQYANPEDWADVIVYNSEKKLFDSIAKANSINSFWKWFAIFALLFLILEMLILKFYK